MVLLFLGSLALPSSANANADQPMCAEEAKQCTQTETHFNAWHSVRLECTQWTCNVCPEDHLPYCELNHYLLDTCIVSACRYDPPPTPVAPPSCAQYHQAQCTEAVRGSCQRWSCHFVAPEAVPKPTCQAHHQAQCTEAVAGRCQRWSCIDTRPPPVAPPSCPVFFAPACTNEQYGYCTQWFCRDDRPPEAPKPSCAAWHSAQCLDSSYGYCTQWFCRDDRPPEAPLPHCEHGFSAQCSEDRYGYCTAYTCRDDRPAPVPKPICPLYHSASCSDDQWGYCTQWRCEEDPLPPEVPDPPCGNWQAVQCSTLERNVCIEKHCVDLPTRQETRGLAPPSDYPSDARYLCAADLNDNGYYGDQGEQAACLPGSASAHCPLRQAVCELSRFDERQSIDARDWRVSVSQYRCPVNASSLCQQVGSQVLCSAERCTADTSSVIIDPTPAPRIDGGGQLDASGVCLDTLSFFGGEERRCRPKGTQTLFQNCCKPSGRVLNDATTGALGSSVAGTMATTQLLSAAKAGAAALQTGASISQATSVASTTFIGGFDPTTLAISLAITFLNEMLENQCDKGGPEASMLSDSGFCYELGTRCIESWTFIFSKRCVQDARVMCCFNSELARLIHQQGREQISGLGGFGTPEAPNCRGFTQSEFAALDWSAIDLGDYTEKFQRDYATGLSTQMQLDISNHIATGQ